MPIPGGVQHTSGTSTTTFPGFLRFLLLCFSFLVSHTAADRMIAGVDAGGGEVRLHPSPFNFTNRNFFFLGFLLVDSVESGNEANLCLLWGFLQLLCSFLGWGMIDYIPWKLSKIKKMKLQFLNLKFEEKIILILENGMWQGERAFFFFQKNTVVYLLLCFVLLSLLMTTQKSFVLETFSSVLSSHLCKLVVLHIFSWSIKTFPENSKCGNPEYKLFRTWLAHSMHVTFHHLYVGSILALQTVVRALGIDLNQN